MATYFPGLGAGFGKSLDIDAGAFAGAGAGIPMNPPPVGGGVPPPMYGGGAPWYGGFGGVPYVPVTPLGALGGVKGDLLVPIVAIGVAIFILIIIILAVKAALTWKLALISGLASKASKFRRDTSSTPGPPEEDQLNHLASMVLSAIQSQSCAQNMICQVGTYARTQQGLPSLLRILETVMPKSVQEPLQILRSSAESTINCDQLYKCSKEGSSTPPTTTTPAPPPASNQL